jgi:hypothetical protein
MRVMGNMENIRFLMHWFPHGTQSSVSPQILPSGGPNGTYSGAFYGSVPGSPKD